MINMRRFFLLLPLAFLLFIAVFSYNAYSQNINDEYYDDDEYYDEDEYLLPAWKYLFFDLGYGGSGFGGALGFRYYPLGFSIGATGFASNIPNTTPIIPKSTDYEIKKYPSATVFGDIYWFHDMDDYTLFANIGYYSSVDSVLKYYPDERLYQRHKVEITSGISWGLGAKMPLTFLDEDEAKLDQLMAGIGYHSKMGIYLQLTYRWE